MRTQKGIDMLIQEAIKKLELLTKKNITYDILAEALGISKQAISNRIARKSSLKDFEYQKIKNFLCLDNDMPNIKEHYININYYPDVFGSCGSGTFALSENKEEMTISQQLLNSYSKSRIYSAINARGDSMEPYIQDKDKLIVEHYEGEQIVDNNVYIFRFYEELFIKRLAKNLDQIVVKSDNSIYPIRFIEKQEFEHFQIIGKIVGVIRNL